MKYYLLSVCLLPFAYCFGGIFSEILLPGANLHLPQWLLQAGGLYFAVGAVVLLIDLWRSKRVSDDDRLWWTVVLLFFSFILAPLYWFMVINKGKQAHAAQ